MKVSQRFSARQHTCSGSSYAIARPSVRLSVCPSSKRKRGRQTT